MHYIRYRYLISLITLSPVLTFFPSYVFQPPGSFIRFSCLLPARRPSYHVTLR
jgi:hypothetical protein